MFLPHTLPPACQRQPQHYSLSFRSRADRLVVNKPSGTTHEAVGPGCYDLSKDGKSIGVRTEKRVGRGGCGGMGSTNQFLVDWRAYLKRPPGMKDSCESGGGREGGRGGGCHRCRAGSGSHSGGGASSHDHLGRRNLDPAPSPALQGPPATPTLVPYTLPSQSESWPAARVRSPRAAVGRRDVEEGKQGCSRGTGPRSSQKAGPSQHVSAEEEEHDFFPKRRQQQQQHQQQYQQHQQYQQQHRGDGLYGRAKRPASAAPSLRAGCQAKTFVLPRRCYSLPRRRQHGNGNSTNEPVNSSAGGASLPPTEIVSESCSRTAVSTTSADNSEQPHFVPKPPFVEVVTRPRAATPETNKHVSSFVDILGARNGGGSAQATASPDEEREKRRTFSENTSATVHGNHRRSHDGDGDTRGIERSGGWKGGNVKPGEPTLASAGGSAAKTSVGGVARGIPTTTSETQSHAGKHADKSNSDICHVHKGDSAPHSCKGEANLPTRSAKEDNRETSDNSGDAFAEDVVLPRQSAVASSMASYSADRAAPRSS